MNATRACIFAMAVTLLSMSIWVPSLAMYDYDKDEKTLRAMFDEFMSESRESPDDAAIEDELVSLLNASKNATDDESDVSAQGWNNRNYAQSFHMPSKYSNIRQYCEHLTRVKDVSLTKMYEEALPLTGKMPHGCVPGCLIGNSVAASRSRGPQGGAQAEWIGKCFYPEEGIVRNQIQAQPWFTFGLIEPFVLERFQAEVYVGESMHNTTEEAIIIDYSETPIEFGKSSGAIRMRLERSRLDFSWDVYMQSLQLL